MVTNERSIGMVAFFFLFSSLLLLVQPSHSSPSLLTSNPSFDPETDIFGDAKIIADKNSPGGSHVKLTPPSHSTSGLLLRRHPIPYSTPTSFSIEFSFFISPDPGDGLLLILVPADLAALFPGKGSYGVSNSSQTNSYLGVEFDTSKDDNVGDVNANHVGIDVGSLMSVAVANVSNINLVLNSGQKLRAWVDYEAGSNTLEVRLGKLNEPRSLNPIISHNIDLLKLWGGQSVFVGLSSSNGVKSVQVVSVYSWKISLRNVSNSLHSQPADPQGFGENRKFRPLRFLARLIFGTVCVALVTFVVLFMWVIFFQKHEEESLVKIPDHPATDARYERIDVAVDKNTDDDEH